MTIEERLLHDYGATGIPELGVWLLQNGKMVNGSYEGIQRDIDHRCVSEYYKPSVRAQPGSSFEYVLKFMRRGNIRMTCNEFGYAFELCRQPTYWQLCAMLACAKVARDKNIEFGIARRETRKDRIKNMTQTKFMSMQEYLQHLSHYNRKNLLYWDAALEAAYEFMQAA